MPGRGACSPGPSRPVPCGVGASYTELWPSLRSLVPLSLKAGWEPSVGLGLRAGIVGWVPARSEQERGPLCTGRVSPASEGPRVRAEGAVIWERGVEMGKWGQRNGLSKGSSVLTAGHCPC